MRATKGITYCDLVNMTAAADCDAGPRPPESMSIGELKKELMDLGDSSFVFNDQDELIIALKAARAANPLGASRPPPTSIRLPNSHKPKPVRIHVTPAIPTVKEEPASGPSLSKGTSHTRKSRMSGRRNSLGSKGLNKPNKRVNPLRSNIGQQDESVRLVEYFVMVSCRQRKKDDKVKAPPRPPDPSKDNLDARTLARFEARRGHLQGQGNVDNDSAVHLASIANFSSHFTTSTCSSSAASTCSSDDCDLRSQDYMQSIQGMRPSLNLSGISSSPMPTLKSSAPNDEAEDYPLEPVITARYPAEDRPDHPLNPMLPQFCHPQGTGFIHPSREYKMPRVHHFVLTDSKAGKLYGTCLTVYEEFTPEVMECATEESQEANTKKITHYAPRVLCLLSTWPYLTAFRTYLTQLYRLATSTDLMEAPIERYVTNICSEVPAPPPGAFEVQLSILRTKIRFWAPPAQQPIPYVSLPFQVLFECLDIGNVMYTWYTLACERKVLLVSDQLSLLVTCAEILCSLLFPMRWSHLYIPVLPRSLSPMLDAPMPYLCGISRQNFPYSVGDIGDETVVVDLDRNIITLGPHTPELPPLPHKRRMKLGAALEKNAGHVFWNARGLTQEEAESIRRSGDENALKVMYEKADALWHEKMSTIDEAFNLAHAPDSTSMLYIDDARADASEALGKQSRWDAVQEAFLRFYVAMLKDYRKFLPQEDGLDVRSSWRGPEANTGLRFQTEEFVMSQRHDFQPFLEELTCTQQFDDFITKRIYNAANEPDVTFFDKSIDAKKNRSVLKIKKVDTTFLHSASAHRELQQYFAMEPNRQGLPSSAATKIGVNGHPVFQYPIWPETFNESLFGTPRPIPTNITAEFERRIALRAKLKAKTKELRAMRKSEAGSSTSTMPMAHLDA